MDFKHKTKRWVVGLFNVIPLTESPLNDSSLLLQGDFLNDLCVLNTGDNTWTASSVVGDLPEPRSDTQVRT